MPRKKHLPTKAESKVLAQKELDLIARQEWVNSQLAVIEKTSVKAGIISDHFVPNKFITKLTPAQRDQFVEYVLYWIASNPHVFRKEQFFLDNNTPKILSYNYFKHLLYDDDRYKDYREAIKAICEQRLIEGGLKNKMNPGITKFILSNNYGYSEKIDQKITQTIQEVQFKYDNDVDLDITITDADFEEIKPQDGDDE